MPTLYHGLREGDTARRGDHVSIVIETPAHTAGHVSFHLAGDHIIFVGDTLFAMGCGRLFEGDADQMFANMQRFKALSDDRSEEHTSELQSIMRISYAVFCLKKTNTKKNNNN